MLAMYRRLRHLEGSELRGRAEIVSCDERDRVHPFRAQLHAQLALLRGLSFCAAIICVLIERMVGEARHDVVEAFPSRAEIDKGGEHGGMLLEEELHPSQRIEYCVL
jgi:hypothetical protein